MLQRHLHGVHYPATKAQLLAHARGASASGLSAPWLFCRKSSIRGQPTSARPSGSSRGDSQGPAIRPAVTTSWQYARDQDAALPVIEALLRIPDQDYDDSDAVIIEIIEV